MNNPEVIKAKIENDAFDKDYNKTLKESAKEMRRSYNYVLNVHKKALAAFEEAHENLRFLIWNVKSIYREWFKKWQVQKSI